MGSRNNGEWMRESFYSVGTGSSLTFCQIQREKEWRNKDWHEGF